MNKQQLTERDICTKYILPAVERAGWDLAARADSSLSAVIFTIMRSHEGNNLDRGITWTGNNLDSHRGITWGNNLDSHD